MTGPLIIQSDHTLLLEVEHPQYVECRDFLVLFAELVKSPEFIHTYKVTPLSLWNAAALEISQQDIFDGLQGFSKYSIPISRDSFLECPCSISVSIIFSMALKFGIRLVSWKIKLKC